MRKVTLAILLLVALASCSKDEPEQLPGDDLVSPSLSAYVRNMEGARNPMTGILEIYPCEKGGAIYYGNYVNKQLTVFNGFYPIEEGHVYEGYNRKLSLPDGTYNVVYWGTPVYEDPMYSSPAIQTPGITLGADMSKLYMSLRKNAEDDTYSPVYDLVYAVEETDIGIEDLSASLRRVVAGVKVVVTTKDKGAFSPIIDKMEVCIGGIAEKLNYYTAIPENMTKTVKFELVPSGDGTQMTNGTVMLFPSGENPSLELRVTLKDGSVHMVSQNISTTLTADTRLTLNIVIGDIFVGGESGDFTIEDWKEATETIEFPIIY